LYKKSELLFQDDISGTFERRFISKRGGTYDKLDEPNKSIRNRRKLDSNEAIDKFF
jgi:hypothetical protein